MQYIMFILSALCSFSVGKIDQVDRRGVREDKYWIDIHAAHTRQNSLRPRYVNESRSRGRFGGALSLSVIRVDWKTRMVIWRECLTHT